MGWLSWLKIIHTDKKEIFSLHKDAWVEVCMSVHTNVCLHVYQVKIFKDIAVKKDFRMLQKASHGVPACSVHARMGRRTQIT